MKSNVMCSNFECDFTTNREDNLKIKELSAIVHDAGGLFENDGSCCPNCLNNTLVYISE